MTRRLNKFTRRYMSQVLYCYECECGSRANYVSEAIRDRMVALHEAQCKGVPDYA